MAAIHVSKDWMEKQWLCETKQAEFVKGVIIY